MIKRMDPITTVPDLKRSSFVSEQPHHIAHLARRIVSHDLQVTDVRLRQGIRAADHIELSNKDMLLALSREKNLVIMLNGEPIFSWIHKDSISNLDFFQSKNKLYLAIFAERQIGYAQIDSQYQVTSPSMSTFFHSLSSLTLNASGTDFYYGGVSNSIRGKGVVSYSRLGSASIMEIYEADSAVLAIERSPFKQPGLMVFGTRNGSINVVKIGKLKSELHELEKFHISDFGVPTNSYLTSASFQGPKEILLGFSSGHIGKISLDGIPAIALEENPRRARLRSSIKIVAYDSKNSQIEAYFA